MKAILIEKIENISAHGISNIFTSKLKVVKILWGLVCLTVWIVCSYSIIHILFQYFHYDYLMNIKEDFEVPIEFPVLTFCNKAPSKFINLTSDDLTDLKQENDRLFNNHKLTYPEKRIALRTLVTRLNQQIDTNDAFNRSILNCVFDGKFCNEDDFHIYAHPKLGLCYEFNGQRGKPIKNQSMPGVNQGFFIEMYLAPSPLTAYGIPTFTEGIEFAVHEKRKFNVNKVKLISTGIKTAFIIKQTRMKKLKKPYSDCEDLKTIDDYESKLYKQTFAIKGFYEKR